MQLRLTAYDVAAAVALLATVRDKLTDRQVKICEIVRAIPRDNPVIEDLSNDDFAEFNKLQLTFPAAIYNYQNGYVL